MSSTQPTLHNVARCEWLRRYAGWTADDIEEFDAAMRAQRVVDARSSEMTPVARVVLETSTSSRLRAGMASCSRET